MGKEDRNLFYWIQMGRFRQKMCGSLNYYRELARKHTMMMVTMGFILQKDASELAG